LRLNKKLVAAAGSLAVAGGLTAAAVGSAGAPPPKIDVGTRSVTCNDTLGKIKFSVPLTLGGTTPNAISVGIKSGDCVDNTQGAYDASLNPTGVTLKNFASKGTLNATTNDCLGLQGLSTGTTGSITGKFATVPGTSKLLDAANTIAVGQTYGGTFNDGGTTSPASDSASWASQYGLFQIGTGAFIPTSAPTVTGAYHNDGGASFQFDGTTAESTGNLANQCFTTGIKGITFGIGAFTS